MNWLLLRGLSREKRHWGRFPALLAEATQAGVHCLDLPGFGTERGRPSPADIAGIVEDLRARWRPLAEANPGPWGLLGMSLGGMVTMQWATSHPQDFARVVLVNTSAGNLSAPWERMSPSVLPKVVRSLFDTDDASRERRILGMTTCLATNLDEVAEEWAGYAREGRPERIAVLRQLWAAMRFKAPARLEMPALVVSGAKDPFTAPACQRKLATHLKADLEVHPGAGHELAVDAAPWLAERVAAWTAEEVRRAG